MVFFCIPCLALVAYFAVAGIFFPRYRGYIRDGWRCFTDKLRRRKCSVSFDNRMRMALSAWLAQHGMARLGRFLNDERNFNITLTVLGVAFTILSIYLLYLYVHFWFYPPCVQGSICSVQGL